MAKYKPLRRYQEEHANARPGICADLAPIIIWLLLQSLLNPRRVGHASFFRFRRADKYAVGRVHSGRSYYRGVFMRVLGIMLNRARRIGALCKFPQYSAVMKILLALGMQRSVSVPFLVHRLGQVMFRCLLEIPQFFVNEDLVGIRVA